MSALFMGLALVIGSAAVFGLALFGVRPVPQPATAVAPDQRAPRDAGTSGTAPQERRPEAIHLRGADVRPTLRRRLQAVALLALSIAGSALLVGAVVSILFVGAVLLIS